ncbi:hypothetical protein CX676_17050 [Paracoccus zhejiangensis]|uniref:Uncharacterized protein n=1 Tax=Paracoccus zhejiangensis TaxID=1077935 RepID=A0A2H5F285_9RHOB|nr:hypothetical protein CX676_17050 [Paracoccus zhejiangensis]
MDRRRNAVPYLQQLVIVPIKLVISQHRLELYLNHSCLCKKLVGLDKPSIAPLHPEELVIFFFYWNAVEWITNPLQFVRNSVRKKNSFFRHFTSSSGLTLISPRCKLLIRDNDASNDRKARD